MAYLSFWTIRKRRKRNTRQYSPNRPMKLFQTLQKRFVLTQKERHYQIKRWKTIRLCLSCCLSFPTTWSFRLQMCMFATSIRYSSFVCSCVAAKRLQRVSAALACSYARFDSTAWKRTRRSFTATIPPSSTNPSPFTTSTSISTRAQTVPSL